MWQATPSLVRHFVQRHRKGVYQAFQTNNDTKKALCSGPADQTYRVYSSSFLRRPLALGLNAAHAGSKLDKEENITTNYRSLFILYLVDIIEA